MFFSDLAGFTDLSEKLKDQPEKMVEIVNAYLEETSDCLINHGAYVDKYIGDAGWRCSLRNAPNHALAPVNLPSKPSSCSSASTPATPPSA